MAEWWLCLLGSVLLVGVGESDGHASVVTGFAQITVVSEFFDGRYVFHEQAFPAHFHQW